jgi:hypothetical protein
MSIADPKGYGAAQILTKAMGKVIIIAWGCTINIIPFVVHKACRGQDIIIRLHMHPSNNAMH